MPLTVVLVHGAWANGSCWNKVVPLVKARGVGVVAVHNPLTAFDADVAGTRRVVDDQPGDVVLVGHSYGGAVITEVGADPKVKALVYVAAFAPAVGELINSMLAPYGQPPFLGELHADAGGMLTWSASGLAQYFAPDLSTGGEDAAGGHPGAVRCRQLRGQGHLRPAMLESRAGSWSPIRIRSSRRRFSSAAPSGRGRRRSTPTPATSRCLPGRNWWPTPSCPPSTR